MPVRRGLILTVDNAEAVGKAIFNNGRNLDDIIDPDDSSDAAALARSGYHTAKAKAEESHDSS